MALVGARGWARAAVGLFMWALALGLGAGPGLALTVEEIVSSKGIKAWLVEEHSVPLIALKFALAGGASQDPVGKEGLASMVADLLTEGAGDLSEEAFKAQVSSLGMRLSLFVALPATLLFVALAEPLVVLIFLLIAGVGISTLAQPAGDWLRRLPYVIDQLSDRLDFVQVPAKQLKKA